MTQGVGNKEIRDYLQKLQQVEDNCTLHSFIIYSSADVVRMIKSSRMLLMGHQQTSVKNASSETGWVGK